ncbi:MAG: hypothetical protein JXA28_13875 [Bacteroidetes bacterium]|nr:hypothetical protein [Bacteroidota bacterium]
MSPRRVILLMLFLAPGFFATAQQVLPDSLRIVVLGSSTAAGAGSSMRDSAWVWRYRAFLQSLNPSYDVVNLAVGGYTTYHVQPLGYQPPQDRPLPDSARNITTAIALSASAVIINMPSNDAARNFSIVEQAQNFERIAAEAAAAGIPLWVCTTQPRNLPEAQRFSLLTMRDWITTTYGDHAVDFWSVLAADGGMILPTYDAGDGVHLNNAGHRLLFERIRDARIPERLQQATPITELPENAGLELTPFPQPARDIVTFRIRVEQADSWMLIVRDLLGKVVYRTEAPTQSGVFYHNFDAGGLPRGLYHVLLRSGDAVLAQRVLLVH